MIYEHHRRTTHGRHSATKFGRALALLIASLGCGTDNTTGPPGAPAAILIVAGDAQSGTAGAELPAPLVVRVTDADERPVSNQIVNFRVVEGGGSVFAGVSLTNAAGEARERWTLGTVAGESQRLEARAVDSNTGAAVVFATFHATAVAQTASKLSKASTDAGQATVGTAVTPSPSVKVVDQYDNPVAGTAVVFAVASGGGSITGPTQTTNSNGLATVGSWTLGTSAGSNTLTATVTGLTGSPLMFAVTGISATYSVSSSATSVTVGTPVTINAQLVDGSGAPIPTAGAIVTWTSSDARGTFASATSTTNTSGLASVSYTVDTVDGRTTITATDNNLNSGATAILRIAGPATKLAFNVSPSAAGWRAIIKPAVVVTVQDRYSNSATAVSPPVTLSLGGGPGGATLTGGGSTPAVSGIATFPGVIVDPPGLGYSLTASSPGLTAATSSQFEVITIGTLYQSTWSRSLTVSGGSVYFTNCSAGYTDFYNGVQTCSITAVPTTGGTFAATIDNTSSDGKFGGRLLANGQFIDLLTAGPTWTSSGGVRRIPTGGGAHQNLSLTNACATTTLESNRGPDLEFDGASFYMNFGAFADPDGSSGILRLRAADGACQVLLATPPYGPQVVWPLFAIAGGQLYYFDSTAALGRTIQGMSVDSGPSSTVVTGVGGMQMGYPWRQMLVVDNTIYWVQEGGLLRSAPISGGVPTTRANDVTGPLVSDGTFLYANGNGALVRFRLSDFTMVVIADHEIAIDLALDSEALYWANHNGIIKKTRK